MKTEILKINKIADKVQYLTEVLPQIPTNTILSKTLTGLGATYGEIKANRHSIIVEPNVPVIVGKCNDPKHKKDNLFGVYEGIYTDKVIEYIEQSNDKNIKILTTPESFIKIKDAFESLDMDIYCTCFLLFDECHKIVKDVDYRSNIILPIDDFFKFEQKALVSATPIQFTDARFEKQGFKTIQIEPTFPYKSPIDLINTNNVLEYLKRTISNFNSQVCFFINSTDLILAFIKQLGIEEESTVFCAKKSVDKLKSNKFKNTFDHWKKDRMKKYNFFTSRFYNALDIELEDKPDIILISEVYFAEYSMIDPKTDSIQAVGRFRNGVNSITHIFNTNTSFSYRTKEQINGYLQACEDVYTTLKTFYYSATSEGARDSFRSALDVIPFSKMIDKMGNKNCFAIDNYIDEAMMKSSYSNYENLVGAYRNCGNFEVTIETHSYPLGDYERLKRENKSTSIKDKRREIVAQLELLGDDLSTDLHRTYKADLRFADSFIVEAYETVGKAVIESLNYSTKRIREAMILKRVREKTEGSELIQLINNSFEVGKKYTCKYLKEELIRIYSVLDIRPEKTITAQSIKQFFLTKDAKVLNSKGLLLVERMI